MTSISKPIIMKPLCKGAIKQTKICSNNIIKVHTRMHPVPSQTVRSLRPVPNQAVPSSHPVTSHGTVHASCL